MVDYLDWFLNIESDLRPWNIPLGLGVYIFLYIAKTYLLRLLRIFVFIVMRNTGLYLSFMYCCCFQGNTSFIKWIGRCYLLFFLWEKLYRISVDSSLNIWQNPPEKPSGPGEFLWGGEIGVLNYQFNFLNCYRTIQMTYFILG